MWHLLAHDVLYSCIPPCVLCMDTERHHIIFHSHVPIRAHTMPLFTVPRMILEQVLYAYSSIKYWRCVRFIFQRRFFFQVFSGRGESVARNVHRGCLSSFPAMVS